MEVADCITYISYAQTHAFSALVNHYLQGGSNLKTFYNYTPDRGGIEAAIAQRKEYPVNRGLLADVLREQYNNLKSFERLDANIVLLQQDTTYTITTAHQPNLLTGYLYFFYKIIHAIKMADELNAQYTDKHFVPVYYMGSEDNDLEELGTFNYLDRKFVWDANGQTGAVGRMKTQSLKALTDDLYKILGPPTAFTQEIKELINEAYLSKGATVASATLKLVHELFGKYGLIIINPDNAAFKRQFIPVIKDDILNCNAYPLVQETNTRLAQFYKPQAFSRPINFFYLNEGIRERIEKAGDVYKVVNTGIQFTRPGIIAEIEQHPEHFSPNVILRGVFQETLLPDVAFIGGGAEIAYWLQLKPVFEHYNVFYPALFVRKSVQWISKAQQAQMQKAGLDILSVFLPNQTLIDRKALEAGNYDISLDNEIESLKNLMQHVVSKVEVIDATLVNTTQAMAVKMEKLLHSLEKKMMRAVRKKNQVNADRINALKSSLFPGGGLQERSENFLTYYTIYGAAFIEILYKATDAFNNKFLVVEAAC